MTLADLNEPGQAFLAAEGGKPGVGNRYMRIKDFDDIPDVSQCSGPTLQPQRVGASSLDVHELATTSL